MCGIAGLINIKNGAKKFSKNDLDGICKALEVQKHRGPDDTGVCGFSFLNQSSYAGKNILEAYLPEVPIEGIIGFNRLSIKDLSMAGHQPMTALGGKVILAFNGEIYNDKELRREIELKTDYHFKSATDTEVILAMYLTYGFEATISRLNGMFAIVIADLRTGEVWFARDRYGIKPLYYTFYNGRIGFASELKCICQYDDFEARLDLDAFNARLIFSRPGDKVLYKDVELIEPGCAIHISVDEEPKFIRYYSIDNHRREENVYKNLSEAKEAVIDVIKKSVSRQMVSDVKVGCQLSGGIDSTLVSYFANKQKTDNMNDAVSIIDSKGLIGEEEYIDFVGAKLDLELHKFSLEEDYFLKNYERMIWQNDAPVYQPYFICFMKLAEAAKKYVTVLLSGEGADEIAGGYNRFAMGVYQPFLSKLNASAHIKSFKTYAEYAVLSDQTFTDFTSIGYDKADELLQEQIDCFNKFTGTNFTKHLKFETYRRLPEGLLRQDKMTMATSIENRVPLLDNEVVDCIMALPETMLVRFKGESPFGLSENPLDWVQGKYILKDITSDYFGQEFAYRRKQIMALDKRAMVTSEGFKEYFYDAVYPGLKQRGLMDSVSIEKMFRNAGTISDREFTCMWRAVSLETWCQLFLERKAL